MATITFYNFNKRRNSTAIPTTGDQTDVYLKDGCSLLSPVFMLSLSSVPSWNMCLFEGRYYRITDIVNIRNELYEIHADVDVLATWKNDIMAASAFVAYDTAANTEIPDNRLSAKTTGSVAVSNGSFSWLTTSSLTGTVVMAITGRSGVCYYLMTPTEADTLMSSINGWLNGVDLDIPDPSDFGDVLDALGQMAVTVSAGFRQFIATGRAADNIRSATWFPFPMSVFPSSSRNVSLGEYNTQRTAPALSQISITDAATISIPWQATDWRKNAPYHEIIVEIPYIGTISVNPSTVINCTSLSIFVGMDTRTGEAVARLSGDSGVIIGNYSFNAGGTYAVGSSNVTPVQALTALGIGAGTIAAAAVAPGALGAAAAGTGGIAGMLSHLGAQTTAISSGSGAAGSRIAQAPRCITIFHDTIAAPDNTSAVIGTPAGYVQALSGKTGYVETRCFSVGGTMTEREREEINRLMDGGVYIE